MNSKIPFIAVVLLLIISLFFVQKSQKTISDSIKAIGELTDRVEKIEKKLNNSSSKALSSDSDPSEKDKFSAVDANVSTDIYQNNTGKIDLEKHSAFEGIISTVVIEANSLTPIQNIPTGAPAIEQIDLINVGTYVSGNLVTLDSNQRYIEVNASPQQGTGDKLFSFRFQVKGIDCNCWSDYKDGYLTISVN